MSPHRLWGWCAKLVITGIHSHCYRVWLLQWEYPSSCLCLFIWNRPVIGRHQRSARIREQLNGFVNASRWRCTRIALRPNSLRLQGWGTKRISATHMYYRNLPAYCRPSHANIRTESVHTCMWMCMYLERLINFVDIQWNLCSVILSFTCTVQLTFNIAYMFFQEP